MGRRWWPSLAGGQHAVVNRQRFSSGDYGRLVGRHTIARGVLGLMAINEPHKSDPAHTHHPAAECAVLHAL